MSDYIHIIISSCFLVVQNMPGLSAVFQKSRQVKDRSKTSQNGSTTGQRQEETVMKTSLLVCTCELSICHSYSQRHLKQCVKHRTYENLQACATALNYLLT